MKGSFVNQLVARPWFGSALLLAVALGILGAAWMLEPTQEAVSLFGVEVPTVCGFRLLTGYGCPGCGLTRSFSFMAHGQFVEAVRINPLGPLGFTLVVALVPFQGIRLWRVGTGRA